MMGRISSRRATFTLLIPRAGSQASFQQDTPPFTPISWRGRQRAYARRQPPFLYVRLDEDETGLTEVDVYARRTARTDTGKEVEPLETGERVLVLSAVPGKEDDAGTRAVAYAEDVAFCQRRAVGGGGEGVVVRLEPVREVRDRVSIQA